VILIPTGYHEEKKIAWAFPKLKMPPWDFTPCKCTSKSTKKNLRGFMYRPFRDLRSMPDAGTQVLFLRKAQLGFFHFLEIVTCWLLLSASQKIPVQPGGYLPPHKIPHAENRFLWAGKGAENTKEKSRQWFTKIENAPWDFTPYKSTSKYSENIS
jgi:hypothetical protein